MFPNHEEIPNELCDTTRNYSLIFKKTALPRDGRQIKMLPPLPSYTPFITRCRNFVKCTTIHYVEMLLYFSYAKGSREPRGRDYQCSLFDRLKERMWKINRKKQNLKK